MRFLPTILAALLLATASVAEAQSTAPAPGSGGTAHGGASVTERRGAHRSHRHRHRSPHRHRAIHENAPSPTSTSTPRPTPVPTPTTAGPAPAPSPSPAPTPKPKPKPAPAPSPAPEPAPNPEPAASPSDVLFKASRLSDFWLRQSAPGAITEAPDPAGSGKKVFKLTVSDEDVYPITPTENPRAEMLSPSNIRAGDELWWSAKFFLPADFPASTANFVTLLQGPYGRPWDGTPPFHIEVNGGVLKWQRNSTYNWDIPWQVPLIRNRWVSFMIHERFASDGWIEMWVDGQPITFFSSSPYNPGHHAPTSDWRWRPRTAPTTNRPARSMR